MKTEPKSFRKFFFNATRCPACGRKSVTHNSDYPSDVKPFAKHRVSYCSACGLGFVPGARDMLEAYYKRDYATQNRGDRVIAPEVYFTEAHRETSRMLTRYFARASRQIALLKRFDATFERVLDFGSGPGYFLHVSEAPKKFAFEPDEFSEKYLDHIGATRFAHLDEIEAESFDVIVASHSIEHLVAEDLHLTLEKLIAALRPGGRFLIEVPHGGHSYLHLGARQDPHTLFFTPQALIEAVSAAGGRCLIEGAVAKTDVALRENAIYHPKGPSFYSSRRGGLNVLCEKR